MPPSKLMSLDDVLDLPCPEPERCIAYGAEPSQFGYLRLPNGAGPHPTAIVVHGGCWRSQYDIDHIASFAHALRATGIATWTIEYRRVGDPGGGWPGTFLDVAAATDCLRLIAAEHQLDLTRVITVGHSAGGQLALWLAGRWKLPRKSAIRGGAPLGLKGVVSLAAVDDLRRALAESVCGDMAGRLIGGTPEAFPRRYAEASPIELVPLGVRQHLLHGALDPIVPVAFARDFAAASARAGDAVALTVVEDTGHFEPIAPTSKAWPAVRDAILDLAG